MAKAVKRKAAKKAKVDPNLQSVAETKRRLRNIDRSYKEIGRLVSSVTAKRERLDLQLRMFANRTLDRLDREAREPFNLPPANEEV